MADSASINGNEKKQQEGTQGCQKFRIGNFEKKKKGRLEDTRRPPKSSWVNVNRSRGVRYSAKKHRPPPRSAAQPLCSALREVCTAEVFSERKCSMNESAENILCARVAKLIQLVDRRLHPQYCSGPALLRGQFR
jgi:hypothetical protein